MGSIKDPVVSNAEIDEPVSGGDVHPFGKGSRWAESDSHSSKQLGEAGESGLCTEDADKLFQGGSKSGMTDGTSSTSKMALSFPSQMAMAFGEVGDPFLLLGSDSMGVEILGVEKAFNRQRWNMLEGVPRLLQRNGVYGDNEQALAMGSVSPSFDEMVEVSTRDGSKEA